MDNKLERVYEKIRKLLAMADDVSSPKEAEIAARQAQALMRKHQIDNIEEVLENIESKIKGVMFVNEAYKPKTHPKWYETLLTLIGVINDIEVVRLINPSTKETKVELFGYKDDIEMAKFMILFLTETVKRLSDQKKNEMEEANGDPWGEETVSFREFFQYHGNPRKFLADYRFGLVMGVASVLYKEKKEQESSSDSVNQLVTTKNAVVSDALAEKYEDLQLENRDVDLYDNVMASAYNSGVNDGSEIRVGKQLESS